MSFAYKYLNGEQLFRVYWVDMGQARSYTTLQKWCISNKIFNPMTNNYPSRMGVWKAMWRWAVNHKDDAYKIISEGMVNQGGYISREQFEKELNEKVFTSYQSKNFAARWQKENAS